MRPAYDNPAELKARICERHERGLRLEQIARIPGLPSTATIMRWQRADPDFARQLASARMWGRALVKESRGDFTFDAPAAEDFLRRVRMGEGVCAILRSPGPPTRNKLNAWKRLRPDFAAELEQAKREARRPRRPEYFPYDEAVADRIILQVVAGVRVRCLRRTDPSLPGTPTLQRWRRQHPDFDGAIRIAMRHGHLRNVRAAARDGCTPHMAASVIRRIRAGATLRQVGETPGLPPAGTLYAWIRKRPDFAAAVMHAYRDRQLFFAEEVGDLARTCTPDAAAGTERAFARLRRREGGARPWPGQKRWGN